MRYIVILKSSFFAQLSKNCAKVGLFYDSTKFLHRILLFVQEIVVRMTIIPLKKGARGMSRLLWSIDLSECLPILWNIPLPPSQGGLFIINKHKKKADTVSQPVRLSCKKLRFHNPSSCRIFKSLTFLFNFPFHAIIYVKVNYK